MTAQSMLDTFTLDEEIDEWIMGDDSVEIKGFVDSIEGTKMVTPSTGLSKQQVALYKIVINNGATKRVRVLFWGTVADQYSSKIIDRTVITIIRAKTVKPNPRYINPQDNLFALELTVLPSTKIIIDENTFKDLTVPHEIRTVDMDDLEGLEEIVNVCGYLKQQFSSVTMFGSTYGGGVLASGKTRLPIKISNYTKTACFLLGSHLQMVGKVVTPLNGPTHLLVASVDDINVVRDSAILTPDKMRPLGVRPPKRKSEEVFDHRDSKK
ncbi:uncharacterized protein LOC123270684 [Cotesia glomerata]|uniref:uncharacterized protein LOC123270684 n=1 Tax=Cotesia glomerata TaxID=32391 RepID=UPI001D01F08F|nr:uncharacterized protein LOC123270684 [Cotesia glomerata]